MSSREGRESVFAKLYYVHKPHTPRVLPAGQVHQRPAMQPRAPSLTKPCDLSVVSFPAGDRDLQTPQTSRSSPLSSPAWDQALPTADRPGICQLSQELPLGIPASQGFCPAPERHCLLCPEAATSPQPRTDRFLLGSESCWRQDNLSRCSFMFCSTPFPLLIPRW